MKPDPGSFSLSGGSPGKRHPLFSAQHQPIFPYLQLISTISHGQVTLAGWRADRHGHEEILQQVAVTHCLAAASCQT
jgi:hypothetical protein